MRVAILHDYLNQYGGAERVLEVMLEMFPDADLYTLLHDAERTHGVFADNVVKTSALDNWLVRRKHRAFIPLMPLASKTVKGLRNYDLVLSSTAGYAKGFPVRGKYHVCYCHSPLRYAWEIDYLKNLGGAPAAMKDFVAYPIAKALRRWDKKASENVNFFVANSEFIAGKIAAYYRRDARVVHPPVNPVFWPERKADGDYWLMAGRLLYYKGFDIAIRAFNDLKKPLFIVGNGPEAAKLRALARSPKIRFLTNVSDEQLRRLYSDAKGFVFPQIEDFGLVAAEAQTCGTPVVAYKVGGGGEIVEHRKTGLLIDRQTPEAIADAVREAEAMRFDRAYIAKRAEKFSKAAFVRGLEDAIRSCGYDV